MGVECLIRRLTTGIQLKLWAFYPHPTLPRKAMLLKLEPSPLQGEGRVGVNRLKLAPISKLHWAFQTFHPHPKAPFASLFPPSRGKELIQQHWVYPPEWRCVK